VNKRLSFPKSKINILLLEAVHTVSEECFADAGYSVKMLSSALPEKELLKIMPNVHILGIRSKTNVTAKVIDVAKNLLAVGCFCIGTNQVALTSAANRGIVVFNAPFSNTRSVAELTMAELVMLARKAAHKSLLLHNGTWDKSADGCIEVRNKTIGLIGYGHIGPQVGLLAEAFGMKVYFYDILSKLPLGNATQVKSLKELLELSDFVSLHVPETERTKNMISSKELSLMKKGSFLLNLSRGSVVDVKALAASIKAKHIAGAALDVFPEEPNSNDEKFESILCGLPNVILTPHIGGSTVEAQRNIGIEVSNSLINYIDTGSTSGAVNFPKIELPLLEGSHRILNIHKNVPGVLSAITGIVAEMGGNIRSQYLNTLADIGYLIMDVDERVSREVKKKIDALDTNIKTRLLF
jgi:D-3-phosphoglycerate dehydrogenase / 2-oxoglutarate reductase